MKPFASSARWLVAVLIIIQVRNYTCLVLIRQVGFQRLEDVDLRVLGELGDLALLPPLEPGSRQLKAEQDL